MKNNLQPLFYITVFSIFFSCSNDQSKDTFIEITPLESGSTASFRGIASKNSQNVWVSGTGGTVLYSENSGESWQSIQLPGADSLDFRDIAILDDQTILMMSVGNGQDSRIYKSNDKGQNWRTVLINQKEKAFFNGLDFWNDKSGILVSDPIDEKLYILKTENAGESWVRVGGSSLPALNPVEYGFAASGTGVVTKASKNIWIATGGDKARVFHSTNAGKSWIARSTPMFSGNASSGIFSISFRDSLNGIAVGGDYLAPDTSVVTLIRTTDGARTWETITDGPAKGHKACVQSLGNGLYIAAGRTGVIWSEDDGLTWEEITKEAYYTISYDEQSKVGFLAGPDGKLARFELKSE